MTEARRILVNPHTSADQSRIVGPCLLVNQFLVRDPRGDDSHVNPSLRGAHHLPPHFVRNNQIRCHEIRVVLGRPEHIHVHLFTGRLIVERAVRIGLHIAVTLDPAGNLRQIFLHIAIRVGVTEQIPHFQKDQRKTAHGSALQTNSGILPEAIRLCYMKIFIRHIVTAGIGNFPVDHHDFPVIPVVDEDIEQREHRVEPDAVDARLFHFPVKFPVQKSNASDIIVDHTDLHALRSFFLQNPKHSFKSALLFNREIFHEDMMLRILQILKL